MSLHPNAEKQAENAAELNKKKINFESAMVDIGTLVTYICSAAVKRTLSLAGSAVKKINHSLVPLGKEIADASLIKMKNFGRGFVRFAENISAINGKFAERMAEVGFGKALILQLSDIGAAIKNNKNFTKTVINHTVPVLGIALLIGVVAEKTSADYGVSVEYNGQEIGVVSEESVINQAQQVVADRATYFDTESETYITAMLSLKPLGAQDKVIDEQMLADAIQEQIDTQIVEAEPVEEIPVEAEEPVDMIESTVDKERAYVITVDGEFIGAVTDNTAIENFLETKKTEYAGEGVIEVSFDKNVEYTYENYVMPDQVVEQIDIIEKLDSLVTEPVYYEVVKGDNPWDVAIDNGMTMDELNECFASYKGEEIEDITEFFPIGAVIQLSEEVPYLQVMTTREVEYTEEIDYEIVKTEDDDIYKGDYEVDVEGVEGEKRVFAKVTYKGDTPVATEIISEEIISEPITEYRRVGTRETITPVSEGSGGSGVYFWPVDGGYISAYMGDGRGHKGIDIAAPYGTPIYATEAGTITQAETGWNGGYGTCVRIKHDNGEVAMYAHMSSLAEISYGDYVVKGQLIGYVGSTGDSTGNHLHFEIRNAYGSYEDPLDYVSQY
ncbi:MAG: peptidoglycan DD-metalloendopeptidase family protein [Oscillospiraceae bacterium]|nr:peptidoglycan DD-metalloendopeptidase family protein [Oscillospiraceae bacterium]